MVGLAETRVVLDTCAVIQLRNSTYNEFADKSLFQLSGDKKDLVEQRLGEKLRNWLTKGEEKLGWTICITKAAIMESEGEIKNMIERVAGRVKGRPDTVRYLLSNQTHRSLLYQKCSGCSSVSEERMTGIKKLIRSAYDKWENDITRNCVTSYGVRNKSYDPEPQDIRRLAEAVANKDDSSNRVIFLSKDGHFLCHIPTIDKEFRVEVIDYTKL